MLVLAVSLLIAVYGEFRAVDLLLGADVSLDGMLAAVVAFGWTCVTLLGIYAAAWNVAGKEIVSADEDRLTVSRCVGPWCRASTYECRAVSNLRVESEEGGWFGPAWWMFGIKAGTVAFEAENSTVRFGDRLEAQRAQELVDGLEAHMRGRRSARWVGS
jgi:hypothetical protein